MKVYFVSVIALLLASTSCLADEESVEAPESNVTGGKADYETIEPGTAAACGVLLLANTLTELDLKRLGLRQQAGEALVAVRIGDDGIANTSDDVSFSTLADLDAVPYIGKSEFRLLARKAQALDLCAADSDGFYAFAGSACTGPSLTFDQASALLGGAPSRLVGHGSLWTRNRRCDGGKCSEWGKPELKQASLPITFERNDDGVTDALGSLRQAGEIGHDQFATAPGFVSARWSVPLHRWNSTTRAWEDSGIALSRNITATCAKYGAIIRIPMREYTEEVHWSLVANVH